MSQEQHQDEAKQGGGGGDDDVLDTTMQGGFTSEQQSEEKHAQAKAVGKKRGPYKKRGKALGEFETSAPEAAQSTRNVQQKSDSTRNLQPIGDLSAIRNVDQKFDGKGGPSLKRVKYNEEGTIPAAIQAKYNPVLSKTYKILADIKARRLKMQKMELLQKSAPYFKNNLPPLIPGTTTTTAEEKKLEDTPMEKPNEQQQQQQQQEEEKVYQIDTSTPPTMGDVSPPQTEYDNTFHGIMSQQSRYQAAPRYDMATSFGGVLAQQRGAAPQQSSYGNGGGGTQGRFGQSTARKVDSWKSRFV